MEEEEENIVVHEEEENVEDVSPDRLNFVRYAARIYANVILFLDHPSQRISFDTLHRDCEIFVLLGSPTSYNEAKVLLNTCFMEVLDSLPRPKIIEKCDLALQMLQEYVDTHANNELFDKTIALAQIQIMHELLHDDDFMADVATQDLSSLYLELNGSDLHDVWQSTFSEPNGEPPTTNQGVWDLFIENARNGADNAFENGGLLEDAFHT